MSNTKYGVKPEVLKQIKYTDRDKRLAEAGGEYDGNMIQGIVKTSPENWNKGQLAKAKKYKLNERSAEEIRYLFDNEAAGWD